MGSEFMLRRFTTSSLVVCIVLSLLLHLFFIWVNFSEPRAVIAGRDAVSFVQRPLAQFFIVPEPAAVKPTPEIRKPAAISNSGQEQTTKPKALSNAQVENTTPQTETVVNNPSRQQALVAPVKAVIEKVSDAGSGMTGLEQQPVGGQAQKSSKRVDTDSLIPQKPETKESFDKELMGSSLVQSEELSVFPSPGAADLAAAIADRQKKSFQQALPRYDRNPLPRYPEVARRRGYQGTVEFKVLVLADGRVGESHLVTSSGFKLLDLAARKAVDRWQFKPATSFSVPVDSWVLVPVDFNLKN